MSSDSRDYVYMLQNYGQREKDILKVVKLYHFIIYKISEIDNLGEFSIDQFCNINHIQVSFNNPIICSNNGVPISISLIIIDGQTLNCELYNKQWTIRHDSPIIKTSLRFMVTKMLNIDPERFNTIIEMGLLQGV